MTGVVPCDCVVEEDEGRIIFVVDKADYEKALGENAINVKFLNTLFNMRVEILKYEEDPISFIKEALLPKRTDMVRDIRLAERGGRKIVYVAVEPSHKAIAIGKGGRNIRKVRKLARKYFNIDNVVIV